MSAATMNGYELQSLRVAASLITKLTGHVEEVEGKQQCLDLAATLKRLAWLHEQGRYNSDGHHVVIVGERPAIHVWEAEEEFRASDFA